MNSNVKESNCSKHSKVKCDSKRQRIGLRRRHESSQTLQGAASNSSKKVIKNLGLSSPTKVRRSSNQLNTGFKSPAKLSSGILNLQNVNKPPLKNKEPPKEKDTIKEEDQSADLSSSQSYPSTKKDEEEEKFSPVKSMISNQTGDSGSPSKRKKLKFTYQK